MFNIEQFLGKIRARQTSGEAVRIAVIEALKEYVGLEVIGKDVEIKPPQIFLKNIPQTARTEIFIKKKSILENINKKHGGRPFTDIR